MGGGWEVKLMSLSAVLHFYPKNVGRKAQNPQNASKWPKMRATTINEPNLKNETYALHFRSNLNISVHKFSLKLA